MVAAITARRGDAATGSIAAGHEVIAVEATGLTVVTTDPVPVPVKYYMTAEATGKDTLRSVVFSPSSDGKFTWDNLILSAAATWALHVRKVSDDSSVANHSYTAA